MIGRKEEIRLLREYYESGKPEFVALYGRRRIGKTYLIDELFKNQFAFKISGVIDGERAEQTSAFMLGLRSLGYTGKAPTKWMDAFFLLQQLLEPTLTTGKRCIIFIDELPCFDTPKSGFVRALGHFWNTWCQTHPEVMLIVCGSATTWMMSNVIDNHGGLHNRITHEIHLHPFTLAETEQLLQENNVVLDRLSIAQLYMALGGIPYYLNMLQRGDSVATALDRLFFSQQASMRSEYERLFSSLFREPAPYLEIISVLASVRQGMTREQIVKAWGKTDNGHLSDYLNNLIKCDFVRYYYTKSKKIKKTDGVYQLTDFFVIFYNTFLRRPITDEHFWSHNLQTSVSNVWYGLAFERLCMAHIPQIKHALGIDKIGTEYYAWRSRESENGAQIDLLIERADRIINLCEIKYSTAEYRMTKEENLKMRNRQDDFVRETSTRYTIQSALITTFGLRLNEYSGGITEVITLDELFAEW